MKTLGCLLNWIIGITLVVCFGIGAVFYFTISLIFAFTETMYIINEEWEVYQRRRAWENRFPHKRNYRET